MQTMPVATTPMAMQESSKAECEVTWDGSSKCSLSLWLNPVPASRPRVTRWGTYYSKTYKNWMAIADDSIPTATYQFEGLVKVHVDFYVVKPKSSKLSRPRGDIDNYLKAILDAVTKKGYWLDDDEIVHLTATKQFSSSKDGLIEMTISDL